MVALGVNICHDTGRRLEIPQVTFHNPLQHVDGHQQLTCYSLVWVLCPNVSLDEALEGVARVPGPDTICD